VSLLGQRLVAALLGATVVWRAVNGVGALMRWLWLGERLGNVPMLFFFLSVIVAPVVGGIGGDAALRNRIWSRTRLADARRRESILALTTLPVLSNLLLSTLLPTHELLLPLRGGVTLSLLVLVVVGERRAGPLVLRSGGNE
jgi:hypothetical protein